MQISVIGLGKLGSPLAGLLAARGHDVVGVDINERVVRAINEGKAPAREPGLPRLLAQSAGKLLATTDIALAVERSELSFLLVPTPSQSQGGFSLRHVMRAARSIGDALAAKPSRHVVVLVSTVMPGDTGGKVLPVLEEASGKRCGPDFGLCYSPEFIALGSVIRDLSHPEFVLIGESDSRSGDRLWEVIQSLCLNQPPVVRTSFINAELAKLAVNTFVTTKISFANMLGELCERLPDADVDTVTAAVGLDRRIGSKYLKAGTGFGGPCFPRDNRALAALASELHVEAPLPEATDRVNARQLARLKKLVRAELPPGGTVGILGLAYKPGTPVVEESHGQKLAELLLAEGVPVVVHDPLADPRHAGLPRDRVRFVKSVPECARKADVLVICTPCPEFAGLNDCRRGPRDFRDLKIIDCWRLLDPARLSREIRYIPLGRYRSGDARPGQRRSSEKSHSIR
jgi:UDPglucose 6-dehydrogenase